VTGNPWIDELQSPHQLSYSFLAQVTVALHKGFPLLAAGMFAIMLLL